MVRRFSMVVLALALLGLAQGTRGGPLVYQAFLDGASESPPNASPATGHAIVSFDPVTHLMKVYATFTGLTAGNTAAHIHASTAAPLTGIAGVATTVPTFTGFPTGATSGSYFHVFDMSLASSYNPTFITNNGGTVASAEAVLASALATKRSYLNIHTSNFPGGEIRGFLQAVPEPSTVALAGISLTGLAGYGWRRRRAATR